MHNNWDEVSAGSGHLTDFRRIGTGAHALAGHDEESIEVSGVVGQHVLDPLDSRRQFGILTKAQENDACVGLPANKDQLAEVAIICDENASLAVSDRQYLQIAKAGWVVDGDRRDIMIEGAQVGNEAGVSAFVQEKFHTGAPVCLLFPSTASWAYPSAACTSSIVSRG